MDLSQATPDIAAPDTLSQASPDTIIQMAASILTSGVCIDTATLSLLVVGYLQASTDVESLAAFSKTAKSRAREVVESRKKRRKRVQRWGDKEYRDIAQGAGGIITFQRELVKSKAGRNGLYALEIRHIPSDNEDSWRVPVVVTLDQPNGTKITYDPMDLVADDGKRHVGGCDFHSYDDEDDCDCDGSNGSGNIRVNRISKMMKQSLHGSNEAVPRFFRMGVPNDWSEERVAEYLQEQKDALPAPPRRAQDYDDAGIRMLDLFRSLRQSIPTAIGDPSIVMMVRGHLATEYAKHQERYGSEYRLSGPNDPDSSNGRKLDLGE